MTLNKYILLDTVYNNLLSPGGDTRRGFLFTADEVFDRLDQIPPNVARIFEVSEVETVTRRFLAPKG